MPAALSVDLFLYRIHRTTQMVGRPRQFPNAVHLIRYSQTL